MMKNTRYFTMFLFAVLLSISTVGCKKKKEVFTTFPEPKWEVMHEDYSMTMTAVVELPAHLQPYTSEGDYLAAFAGETCRGVGEVVDGLYYVTIKGTSDDDTGVYFQYYNGRNKYMYKSSNLFAFESDGVFGTVDEPEVLPLSIVE